MALFPAGDCRHVAAWRFAVLAVIGIVYGALVALVQKDFKFVIGYSSVSHMGFVLLGLVTAEPGGLARRGAADVFARHHRRAAVRRGGPDGL